MNEKGVYVEVHPFRYHQLSTDHGPYHGSLGQDLRSSLETTGDRLIASFVAIEEPASCLSKFLSQEKCLSQVDGYARP